MDFGRAVKEPETRLRCRERINASTEDLSLQRSTPEVVLAFFVDDTISGIWDLNGEVSDDGW